MDKMKEVTLDDYVLTNIDTNCNYVIRLKDEKEYIVYRKKPRGQKIITYIRKDGEEIPVSKEVVRMFLSEVKIYERDGI